MKGIRPNVCLAMVLAVGLALFGGLELIAEGQFEYAAALMGGVVTALAVLMKALTDPDINMVPSSVVMKMLDQDAGGEEYGSRFQVRPNAVLCLALIGILSLFGGWAVIDAGNTELGYAVFALGIGAASATLTDLIRPADKDVPEPLADKIVDLVRDMGKSG